MAHSSGQYMNAAANKCALCGGGVLARLLCNRVLILPVTVPDRTLSDAPPVERFVCASCAEAVIDAASDAEELDLQPADVADALVRVSTEPACAS